MFVIGERINGMYTDIKKGIQTGDKKPKEAETANEMKDGEEKGKKSHKSAPSTEPEKIHFFFHPVLLIDSVKVVRKN